MCPQNVRPECVPRMCTHLCLFWTPLFVYTHPQTPAQLPRRLLLPDRPAACRAGARVPHAHTVRRLVRLVPVLVLVPVALPVPTRRRMLARGRAQTAGGPARRGGRILKPLFAQIIGQPAEQAEIHQHRSGPHQQVHPWLVGSGKAGQERSGHRHGVEHGGSARRQCRR